MQRREFISSIGKAAAGIAGYTLLGNSYHNLMHDGKPLNFVFILADDMGWNQVGFIGSDFYETPNIDNIAKEGCYFTDAYAPAPTCSPSRAGIMTGKYPARLHLTEYIPGDQFPWAKLKTPKMVERLPLEEITIAEMLKKKGYVSAMHGKWHLNHDKNYQPGRPGDPGSQGFDSVFTTVKPENDDNPYNDAHHAKKITDEALKFLDQNKDKPFFLYVAHHIVHRPIMEHADLIYKYQEKSNSDQFRNNVIMGAMIERMDTEIGRILKKLEEHNLTENTMVIFFSDNGGYNKLQSQDPLRGGKSMLYEGGIRVPLAIRWPGVIKPGLKITTPVIGTDFFPTFASITGVNELPENIDGVNITPLLKQSADFSRGSIYWHYPHYHRFGYMPSGAVRRGQWKLIEWYERSVYNESNPVSLFNIAEDIGEERDLAKEMPGKAKELWDDLREWRKRVGAQEMDRNPDFDPKKALFWKEDINMNDPAALGQYY